MPLRICFLTAEMTPFAKAGGLADVSGALVKYLYAAGLGQWRHLGGEETDAQWHGPKFT